MDARHLVLRPVRLSDEEVLLAAQRTLGKEGFDFIVGYRDGMSWAEFVGFLKQQHVGGELLEPWAPATFLLADAGNTVVGRMSIRHLLNERLFPIGGHVGYVVLPQYRRRGFATEILRQSLIIARSYDIAPVLVTCDEGNVASARTIERCGGVLENVVDNPEGGPPSSGKASAVRDNMRGLVFRRALSLLNRRYPSRREALAHGCRARRLRRRTGRHHSE